MRIVWILLLFAIAACHLTTTVSCFPTTSTRITSTTDSLSTLYNNNNNRREPVPDELLLLDAETVSSSYRIAKSVLNSHPSHMVMGGGGGSHLVESRDAITGSSSSTASTDRLEFVAFQQHALDADYSDANYTGPAPVLHNRVSFSHSALYSASYAFQMQQQNSGGGSGGEGGQESSVGPTGLISSHDNMFSITYLGSPPAQVRAVVEEACKVWTAQFNLDSIVTVVTLRVSWSALGSNVLGSAGPSYGWLYPSTGFYYPDALIGQLTSEDQNPNAPDIVMTLNSAFSGWHMDLGSPPPSGKHDLFSVVLHELGHGLGVIGFTTSSGGYAGNGVSLFVYDNYVYSYNGNKVYDSAALSSSTTLKNRVTASAGIFFEDGAPAQTATHDSRLYGPSTFQPGSSVYHLDETLYPAGNVDSLMTPILHAAERVSSVGPRTLEILETIGWDVRSCDDYGANCATCAMADCVWCPDSTTPGDPQTGACVKSVSQCEALGASYNSTLTVTQSDSCPSCTVDADCDDPNNFCVTGTCEGSLPSTYCSLTTAVCDDQMDCTENLCDSSVGCVYFDVSNSCEMVAECGQSYGRVGPEDVLSVKSELVERLEVDASQQEIVFDLELSDGQGGSVNTTLRGTSDDRIITEIAVHLYMDKVDGTCAYPARNGQAYASELSVSLVLFTNSTSNTTVHLIRSTDEAQHVYGSYRKDGVVPQSGLWIYRPEDGVGGDPSVDQDLQEDYELYPENYVRLLIVTLDDRNPLGVRAPYPRSGAFHPDQPLLDAFRGESVFQTWKLVVGDSDQGDPVCFYNATLEFTTRPANASEIRISSELNPELDHCVLCTRLYQDDDDGGRDGDANQDSGYQSHDARTLLPSSSYPVIEGFRFGGLNMQKAYRAIPANFFELGSDAYSTLSTDTLGLNFTLCDPSSNSSFTLDLLSDANVGLHGNDTVLNNVAVNHDLRLCATAPITVTYSNVPNRPHELWDIEAVLSESPKVPQLLRSYGTLMLQTYEACNATVSTADNTTDSVHACSYGGPCEASLYAKLRLEFYQQGKPRGNPLYKRVLDEDQPPGYRLTTQKLLNAQACTWQPVIREIHNVTDHYENALDHIVVYQHGLVFHREASLASIVDPCV